MIQFLDKSFNEDDEYVEEEELNSELEDSDLEINLKNKQKFNPNLIRNKIIKIFKRKPNQSTTNPNRTRTATNPINLSHQHPRFRHDRQSDIEEDPPSDISDSTIPVDRWSIESVPKPGFTPMEHLQTLKFVSNKKISQKIFLLNVDQSEDDHYLPRKSTNPFDSNDSPLVSLIHFFVINYSIK